MKLTQKQSQLVTDNMGLVGKVIKDKVHSQTSWGSMPMMIFFKLAVSAYARLRQLTRAAAFLHTLIG